MGVSFTLVPLAAGAAHLQQPCDMLATSNLFGNLSRDKLETLAKYAHAFTWRHSAIPAGPTLYYASVPACHAGAQGLGVG
jgi:hypothetical protein